MKCVLFDFDGVVVDTEPLYEVFWREVPRKYNVAIADFEKKVKGVTLQNILDGLLQDCSISVKDDVVKNLGIFESQMQMPLVLGVVDFIIALKKCNVKIGLVTSSGNVKMKRVLGLIGLETAFDVLITGNMVSTGKPAPDCFLKAAEILEMDPKDCLVFEDSFNGIKAAKAASMHIVGLTTTNSAQMLDPLVDFTIPDFQNINHHLVLFDGGVEFTEVPRTNN